MSFNEYNCLPTIIGSMPHTDPRRACALIARYLKDIPAWPQLPRRSFRENMYAQYSEGFPGVIVQDDKIYVNTAADFQRSLEDLYTAYLANDIDRFPVGRECAAGLYAFLEQPNLMPRAAKGHVTGPLSWGLAVYDQDKRPIIFHETLGDAVPRLLRMKAAWQERELKKISHNTIIFVDEPSMASYGSIVAAGPLARPEKIAEMINEVFQGINGLKGLHCCGNTDWSVLLKTGLDILSFDAYNYAASVALYPREIGRLLARGGAIAWGIVPNDAASLTGETAASLKDRLEEAMAPFTRDNIRFRDLVAHSLLTPSCTLSNLSEEGSEHVLEVLVELSDKMRRRYGM